MSLTELIKQYKKNGNEFNYNMKIKNYVADNNEIKKYKKNILKIYDKYIDRQDYMTLLFLMLSINNKHITNKFGAVIINPLYVNDIIYRYIKKENMYKLKEYIHTTLMFLLYTPEEYTEIILYYIISEKKYKLIKFIPYIWTFNNNNKYYLSSNYFYYKIDKYPKKINNELYLYYSNIFK